MQSFLAGVTAMGFLVASAFFLRFWKRTGDLLFAAFALAFALLALNQTVATLTTFGRDEIGGVWLLRLAAFIIIIFAIVWKNMAKPR